MFFWFLGCWHLSWNYTPSMVKNNDDIAHLLNVSYLDNSALADVIRDYFEDCSPCDAEEIGFISEDFPETRR